MQIPLSSLTTLIPLVAALLDAIAGVGTAFGWFHFTSDQRSAVMAALVAAFALIVAAWTIVAGWIHTTNLKLSGTGRLGGKTPLFR